MSDGSTTIGDWTLDHEIGRGGMGTVWAARRRGGEEDLFAIKILHEHRAESEAVVRRFLREADAARRVRHQGVVAIHEIATNGERPFLVMDLVPGRSLEEHLRAVERDPSAAAAIAKDSEVVSHRDRRYVIAVARMFAGAARALAALHEEGVIHRDVKPANLLLHDDGHIVITDFGIARALDVETMTITGDVLGTPLYLAPERIRNRGRDVDPRSDVYSLGVAMYQMLALEPPFRGETLPELVEVIERGAPIPLMRKCEWMSAALSNVVDRAMSRRPDDRYPDAGSLAEDLERFVAGRSVRARAPSRFARGRRALRRRPALRTAMAIVLALILVGIAGFTWSRVDEARQLRRRHDDIVAEARLAIERGAWGSAWRAALEAERLRPESTAARELKDEVVARASEAVANAAARGGADLLAAAGMSRMVAGFDPSHDAVRRMRSSVGGAIEAEVLKRAGEGDVADVERLIGDGRDLPLEKEELEGIADALDGAAGRAAIGFDYSSAAAFLTMAARLKSAGDTRSAPWTRPGYELLQRFANDLDSIDPVVRADALKRLAAPAPWARLPRAETVRFVRTKIGVLDGGDLERLIALVGMRRLHEGLPDLLALESSSPGIRLAVLNALGSIGDATAAGSLLEASRGTSAERLAAARALGRVGTPAAVARLRAIIEDDGADLELVLAAAHALASVGGDGEAERPATRVAIDRLARLLESDAELVVARALAVLGAFHDGRPATRAARLIAAFLSGDRDAVFPACAAALALGGVASGEEDERILVRLCGSDRAALRTCAALGLAEAGRRRGRSAVAASRLVRSEAVENDASARAALLVALARHGTGALGARLRLLVARVTPGRTSTRPAAVTDDVLARLQRFDEFEGFPLALVRDSRGEAIASCFAIGAAASSADWNQRDRAAAAAELLRIASAEEASAKLRVAAWDAFGGFTDTADLVAAATAIRSASDPDVMTAAALAAARLRLASPNLRPRAITTPEDAWRACRVEALAGDAAAALDWLERAVTMGFEDASRVRSAPELANLDPARVASILAVLK